MTSKQRLSASVDADLLQAAEEAVACGRFVSVSAWVNEALRLKLAQERRLEALSAFMAEYERAHGEITAREMELAARRARGRAIPVRDLATGKAAATRRRRRTA